VIFAASIVLNIQPIFGGKQNDTEDPQMADAADDRDLVALIEGSVDAKLTNCRAIEIAESGLFKGSTTIDEAEIRGRFEGDLIVRNRLLIKATGRVSGTISYGQIEIECGGQIFGDIQAQPAGELGRAPLPGGFAAFIPDDRSGIH
jgi:hypothetical protein